MGHMRSPRPANASGGIAVRWQERFIAAANIELLEARLGSGELDERQAATAQALLADYHERWSNLERFCALGLRGRRTTEPRPAAVFAGA
jgi:hypothetical protein